VTWQALNTPERSSSSSSILFLFYFRWNKLSRKILSI
jgi:hypothetical protein